MKNTILPNITKRQHLLSIATNHYNHLFVAANNFRSKKEFVFQHAFKVHPSVQETGNWDEHWFSSYE